MKEHLYYVAASSFEAACKVDVLPAEHRAAKLHGPSYLAKIRTKVSSEWAAFPGAEVGQLQGELKSAIAPLDYASLNDHIVVPSDENIARWLHQQIAIPNVSTIGIQSTSDQGADLDQNNHAHLWRRFRFESAHRLPNVPAGHPCGRMHGHGFEVILHVEQDIAEQNMGVDFDYIDQCWEPFQQQLNYTCLNDIEGLENPTSEVIAAWLWARIKPTLPDLSWVTVYETQTCGCHFDGEHYRIWKEQRFEGACKLARAPDGDPRRKLHGHSYMLRLHLTAPLDEVMGWTVDYGDVKELFKPIYKQLDHHLINDLPEIEDADIASVLYWIKSQMEGRLASLDRIDLYQTPGCGAVLSWGDHGPALPV